MNERIKKGWKELKAEVIDTDKCCLCGNCSSFCDNISMTPSGPKENGNLCSDNATCRDGFGACYNLCPVAMKGMFSTVTLDEWLHGRHPVDVINAFHHEITVFAARYAGPKAGQRMVAGGAETGLLLAALRSGTIDGVVFSHVKDQVPVIATNEEAILAHAMDPCFAFAPMSIVGRALAAGHENLAVIGSGCEIEALRLMQNNTAFDFESHDLVSLAIGTFCFFKPRPDRLASFLGKNGLSIGDLEWIDFASGPFKFTFNVKGKEFVFMASDLYDATPKGSCPACMDGTAALADISVGRLDSLPAWNVIVIRTARGKHVVDVARDLGLIETKPVNAVQEDLVLEVTRNKVMSCELLEVKDVGDDIKVFTFHAPEIARNYKPGQFIVVWLPGVDFLPMGVSHVQQDRVEITVQAIGDGTRALFQATPGQRIGIRGPYGTGWELAGDDFLLVGGGVGVAALTTAQDALKSAGKRVTSIFGGRTKDVVFCTEHQDACIMTDDGTLGDKGVVTDAVERLVKEKNIKHVLTCGPEIMMKKVHDICRKLNVDVQASLERKMKCCVGMCGTCCVGPGSDIPVCKQGPVFNGEKLALFPRFGTYKK